MSRRSLLALYVVTLVAGLCSLPASGQILPGLPDTRNSPFPKSAVGDPGQGRRVAEGKCAACHGVDGNSSAQQYPKLAGQNPAYLYRQLWAFKTGTRGSQIMSRIVATLSDSDLANAASFFSLQPVQPDPVENPRLQAVGERIYFSGVGSGRVPACAMCHESLGQGRMPMMGMMRMMANVPSLNGQHSAYIIDQLNRFASGERQGMMMGGVAAGLSDDDKRAVAEFLSGRR